MMGPITVGRKKRDSLFCGAHCQFYRLKGEGGKRDDSLSIYGRHCQDRRSVVDSGTLQL